MIKLINDFISTRCEQAKLENENYLDCERNSSDPEEIQAEAEIVCYIKGLRDAIYILKYLGVIK